MSVPETENAAARAFSMITRDIFFALISLYEATFDNRYLVRAAAFTDKAISEYWDSENGGFFLSGSENETLIARTKESYDGAIPCGNSLMTHNLVSLFYLVPDEKRAELLKR